jgi:hypothetical protein
MLPLSPTSTLNPNNVHGGTFTTDQTGGVANSGNTQFGVSGGSAAGLRGGNLYSITGSNGSPSAIQEPMRTTCGAMSGGGRRRKHTKKHRRSRSSKKYARKRSLKYRMKHRRSRSRSRGNSKRSQSGGYHQYMGNTPFTLGFRMPGFPLASNMSALANPTPFMPYNNCDK